MITSRSPHHEANIRKTILVVIYENEVRDDEEGMLDLNEQLMTLGKKQLELKGWLDATGMMGTPRKWEDKLSFNLEILRRQTELRVINARINFVQDTIVKEALNHENL